MVETSKVDLRALCNEKSGLGKAGAAIAIGDKRLFACELDLAHLLRDGRQL